MPEGVHCTLYIYNPAPYGEKLFFIFIGGLQCVGHSFAYFAYFVFL